MRHLSPPYQVAVFLVPRYSQLSLAALVESLRLANTVAGRRLYNWSLCSDGGARVSSSSGFAVEVDCDLAAIEACDALFVVASYDVLDHVTRASLRTLRRLARDGAYIGALDAGGYFLAEAGLLDGRRATVHWDDLEDFQTRYPRVEVVAERFVVDGSRATTSGSLPSFTKWCGRGPGGKAAKEPARTGSVCGPIRTTPSPESTKAHSSSTR